jgi:putative flavoprotein involved in K+ transport
MKAERIDTVVIGGGQAGLAAGYYLAGQKGDFVILDSHERVGDSWRKRWDSLRLFTPASLNRLPGMPFPAAGGYFPTKHEMADYLEAYASHFQLPVELGVWVDELTREDDRYLITAGEQRWKADHVVVATGAYSTPWTPAFAGELDPSITQLHSIAYRNSSQLRDGAVLIAGAGNSGAEIALDLAPSHHIWLGGRDTGHLPGTFGSFAYQVGGNLFLAVAKRLTIDTVLGRRLVTKAKASTGGHPLVRVRPKQLSEASVQRVPRVVAVRDGQPVVEDGRVLEVANVLWATGFRRDFRWIRLPVFDAQGEPIHHRGVVESEPGLYFIGLPFQSSLVSSQVAGTGADAKYVAKQIALRARSLTFRVKEGLAS